MLIVGLRPGHLGSWDTCTVCSRRLTRKKGRERFASDRCKIARQERLVKTDLTLRVYLSRSPRVFIHLYYFRGVSTWPGRPVGSETLSTLDRLISNSSNSPVTIIAHHQRHSRARLARLARVSASLESSLLDSLDAARLYVSRFGRIQYANHGTHRCDILRAINECMATSNGTVECPRRLHTGIYKLSINQSSSTSEPSYAVSSSLGQDRSDRSSVQCGPSSNSSLKSSK